MRYRDGNGRAPASPEAIDAEFDEGSRLRRTLVAVRATLRSLRALSCWARPA